MAYFKEFAKVSQYDNLAAVEDRVNQRDDAVGIVAAENGLEIILQGNEPKEIEDMAKNRQCAL